MQTEPLWTPRYASYKDALLAFADVTEEELAAAMEQIPAATRDRLAAGPLPYRYDCAVCKSFGKAFYDRAGMGGPGDPEPVRDDPEWIVWAYHEAPKAQMKRADQLHYGRWANETYERCLTTYRLAGWTGEAPGANA